MCDRNDIFSKNTRDAFESIIIFTQAFSPWSLLRIMRDAGASCIHSMDHRDDSVKAFFGFIDWKERRNILPIIPALEEAIARLKHVPKPGSIQLMQRLEIHLAEDGYAVKNGKIIQKRTENSLLGSLHK